VPMLRLPAHLPWRVRVELAVKYINNFDPEWISVLFVNYAYHPKGLVHGLAWSIMPLFASRKVHINFHEVWLCRELGWGWRQRSIGVLQRLLIQHFVKKAKPLVMHTNNATFAGLLNQHGIPVTELGLFGNVPVLDSIERNWVVPQVEASLRNRYHPKDLWSFGFFGALHPQWPPEPLLSYLDRASARLGKRVVLLSIGRIGQVGAELWNRMEKDYGSRFAFVRLGEQPAQRISEYLSWLDFGIATTPRAILGKSGTVISMLEHGLPVIVNRDDASFVGPEPYDSEPLLLQCDANLENRLCLRIEKGPRGSRRPRVARAFAQSLAAVSSLSNPKREV
jgi:hypothetical protein